MLKLFKNIYNLGGENLTLFKLFGLIRKKLINIDLLNYRGKTNSLSYKLVEENFIKEFKFAKEINQKLSVIKGLSETIEWYKKICRKK